MRHSRNLPMVTTIGEKCRTCYTCVRECPARAIRIADGQAEVIGERCIGCGNCVRVCSQKAKEVLSGIEDAEALLASGQRVAAVIAPTYPSEFAEMQDEQLVGMVRALGFDLVVEVAFGADLVARRYRELLEATPEKRYIATSCPGVIGYVERYHAGMVEKMAPIVSPMIAIARALRALHEGDLRVVFIGPCIAKKGEAASVRVEGDIDAVLTFVELRGLFAKNRLTPEAVDPSPFDPPHAAKGALFPISRGMLQAADIKEDLLAGDVVATDGRANFAAALREFESGAMDARLLEVLCCNGCIMGAGTTVNTPLFRRRSQVSRSVRRHMENFDAEAWQRAMEQLGDLNLSRDFEPNNLRTGTPSPDELQQIMERMGKRGPEDELNCGACGYETCVEHAIAIYKGRAEMEMCLPHTIEQLRDTVQKLDRTQQALVTSEKLASMGQLAAGIAHEVNNPLGVVLMYAHLMMEEAEKDSEAYEDLHTICEQADRCKKIVSGLLNFARQNKVEYQQTNLSELVERFLETVALPHNVRLKTDLEMRNPFCEIDGDQVIQVITNLVNNALGAMEDVENGVLRVRTIGEEERVRILVSDTGTGIQPNNLKRLFDPFFSTKSAGKGTGLGLSVTYGIVKMHRGDISVDSNADPSKGPTGTTFKITLPRVHEEMPAEASVGEEKEPPAPAGI